MPFLGVFSVQKQCRHTLEENTGVHSRDHFPRNSGAGLAEWAGALVQSTGLIRQTNSQILEVLRADSEVLARI